MSTHHHRDLFLLRTKVVVSLPFLGATQYSKCIANSCRTADAVTNVKDYISIITCLILLYNRKHQKVIQGDSMQLY